MLYSNTCFINNICAKALFWTIQNGQAKLQKNLIRILVYIARSTSENTIQSGTREVCWWVTNSGEHNVGISCWSFIALNKESGDLTI